MRATAVKHHHTFRGRDRSCYVILVPAQRILELKLHDARLESCCLQLCLTQLVHEVGLVLSIFTFIQPGRFLCDVFELGWRRRQAGGTKIWGLGAKIGSDLGALVPMAGAHARGFIDVNSVHDLHSAQFLLRSRGSSQREHVMHRSPPGVAHTKVQSRASPTAALEARIHCICHSDRHRHHMVDIRQSAQVLSRSRELAKTSRHLIQGLLQRADLGRFRLLSHARHALTGTCVLRGCMLPFSTLLAAVACTVTFLPAVVTNGGLFRLWGTFSSTCPRCAPSCRKSRTWACWRSRCRPCSCSGAWRHSSR